MFCILIVDSEREQPFLAYDLPQSTMDLDWPVRALSADRPFPQRKLYLGSKRFFNLIYRD
jgi:hypothetical protein